MRGRGKVGTGVVDAKMVDRYAIAAFFNALNMGLANNFDLCTESPRLENAEVAAPALPLEMVATSYNLEFFSRKENLSKPLLTLSLSRAAPNSKPASTTINLTTESPKLGPRDLCHREGVPSVSLMPFIAADNTGSSGTCTVSCTSDTSYL
jgi:hypothetical protein